MKKSIHIIILIIVALITLIITFALYRPDILESIWLWVIGLIGPIAASVKGVINWLSKKIGRNIEP